MLREAQGETEIKQVVGNSQNQLLKRYEAVRKEMGEF